MFLFIVFTFVCQCRLIDSDGLEEPDTGGEECLSIRDVCSQMEEVEDEHEFLKDKGGFWDLAFLAFKVFRGKVCVNFKVHESFFWYLSVHFCVLACCLLVV